MLYLLDADTLIRGDREFYPLRRFPVFWRWLLHQGQMDQVKIPVEQYEEITVGQGEFVDWLREPEVKEALVLDEEADPDGIGLVLERAYGADLNEDEIELLGRDPFLISYALADPPNRTVVTFEVSAQGETEDSRRMRAAQRRLLQSDRAYSRFRLYNRLARLTGCKWPTADDPLSGVSRSNQPSIQLSGL